MRVEPIKLSCLLRGFGSGEGISEVSGGIFRKEWISLMARNASSLVTDSLCD